MKKWLTLAATALIVTGCNSSGGAKMADVTSDSAAAAIAAAKEVTQQASSKGYAWRDTGKIIKKAEEAAKNNDYAKALKLAQQAKRQSENALQQYQDQMDAHKRL